jgi:NTP pyrophosphatase (non-canonical NTP hydrolase)
VTIVPGPLVVTRPLLAQINRPGAGLARLQHYYTNAAVRRSWDKESVAETLALLDGELAELRAAIEKSAAGLHPDTDKDADVAGELADVQLYLVHLASALGLDLATSVTSKERENTRRFE